jgi:hypothetical protein
MSFAGAVRIYVVAWQMPLARRREPGTLPSIVAGRWAAWAHRDRPLDGAAIADTHSLTDAPCRLPDGSIGRAAVVMEGGRPTVVCHVVRLARVRGARPAQ